MAIKEKVKSHANAVVVYFKELPLYNRQIKKTKG